MLSSVLFLPKELKQSLTPPKVPTKRKGLKHVYLIFTSPIYRYNMVTEANATILLSVKLEF